MCAVNWCRKLRTFRDTGSWNCWSLCDRRKSRDELWGALTTATTAIPLWNRGGALLVAHSIIQYHKLLTDWVSITCCNSHHSSAICPLRRFILKPTFYAVIVSCNSNFDLLPCVKRDTNERGLNPLGEDSTLIFKHFISNIDLKTSHVWSNSSPKSKYINPLSWKVETDMNSLEIFSHCDVLWPAPGFLMTSAMSQCVVSMFSEASNKAYIISSAGVIWESSPTASAGKHLRADVDWCNRPLVGAAGGSPGGWQARAHVPISRFVLRKDLRDSRYYSLC